ncbi:MAG TPA: hypothetical protein VKW06_10420 [Candidatus Angelobacter sp.]|nr:hypothetical protein [Candidatus Angelobacter sp.]
MATAAQVPTSGRTCPACGGKGVLPNPQRNAMQICPNCNGAGTLQLPPIRVPFDVVLPNAVLTALQAGVVAQQQLDQDADFEWVWTVANSTGIFSVTMVDPSTGRQLSTAAVNGENFAGTAQLPFPLVEPYVWARSSLVKATFNDRSNGNNTVQLVLRGFKLYPQSNPAQGSQGAIVAA